MKKLFEGFHRWEILTEEQLLVESILKDAKKKYPKYVDFISKLSERDPSGKNKYLMWSSKQFAKMAEGWAKKAGHEDPVDVPPAELAAAVYPIYQAIADTVDQFHANHQNLKSKKISTDINTYKTIDQINDVLKKLGLTQKLQRAKKREAAKEGATKLDENDDFWMIRPDTTEASCYYGQGTKWCIAATKSKNYFKQYTGEGKAFYMIMMKNLDPTDAGRMITLQYNRYIYGGVEPELIWDWPNDPIKEDDFLEHVTKNIIGGYIADYEKVYEEVKEFASDPTDKNLTENIKKLAIEMLKSGEYETEIDADDIETPQPEELAEAMMDTFRNAQNGLFYTASSHAEENPAGASEEDYQEILAEHDLQNVHVRLHEYEEGFHYSADMSWQLPDDLTYALDEDGEETDFDDWSGDIEQIFRDIADNYWIYPDEISLDNYSGESRIDFQIYPTDASPGIDGFDTWLSEFDEADGKYHQVLEDVLEEMAEQGITVSPENEERKDMFAKLQKLKNFEFSFEKGKVSVHQTEPFEEEFPLAIAMGIPDLIFPEPRPSGRVYTDPRSDWIKWQLKVASTAYETRTAFQYALTNTYSKWYTIAREAEKQMKFPLEEARLSLPVVPSPLRPGEDLKGEFASYEIDLENGGTVAGHIEFYGFLPDSPFINYVYWLDNNLELFYDATTKYLLKQAEERHISNLNQWPEKFKTGKESAVTERVSYRKLYENWKRWPKE